MGGVDQPGEGPDYEPEGRGEIESFDGAVAHNKCLECLKCLKCA
jgi:hypothetical protein